MAVIKEFESRNADIECLEGLIQESSHNVQLKKRLEIELRKVKIGDHAEKNASYLLSSLFKDSTASFLINGLRLELGDDIAQIDHLSFDDLGIVRLFETKTFSTGIKIDDEGTFWRWDAYNKSYVEIPSPIEQSKRHERVVRRAFEQIGYKPELIKHFVVVDYQAKLIKPKKGFENVCRPDRIEKAINDSVESRDLLTGIKLVGKLIMGKKHSPLQIRRYAEKLVELNTPITFNFRAKFGLGPEPEAEQQAVEPITHKVAEPAAVYDVKQVVVTEPEPVTPTQESPPEIKPDKLTLPKLAKSMDLKTTVLESRLIDQGYLERREKGVYLAQKGKDSGFEVRKGKYGYYFLIPSEFSLEVVG